MKSEEQFEEAIRCLKEKEKEEGITDSYKQILLNEKTGCYVEWIQKDKTTPEKTRDLLKDVENSIRQIEVGNKSKLNHIYQSIPEDEDTKQMKVNFETLVKKIQNMEEIEESLYSELLKEVKLVLDINHTLSLHSCSTRW